LGLSKPKGGVTFKKYKNTLDKGDKVAYNNTLFWWREDIKPGDTGTVVKCHGVAMVQGIDPVKDYLYSIELDTPRKEGKEVLLFARWELDLLEAT